MQYSKIYSNIQPSATLAVSEKAKNLKASGKDVLIFTMGEPDFKTPLNIREKAEEILKEGHIGYTTSSGILALKQAICDKLEKDNKLKYKPENIVVSNGAKHALRNVIEAVLNPEDEVIIPSPYWVTYSELVKMSCGIPVVIEGKAENDYKVSASDIEKAITDKTKALILNSPSNPTGAVYTEKELKEIADVAVSHNIIVISDEIYEKLVYEGEHISIASFNEEIKKLTAVINGFSKSYAMTGWRVGYSASEKNLSKIISDMQSHTTSNINTLAQYAALEALNGTQDTVVQMKAEFKNRRDYIIERIDKMPLVIANKPKGAFYVFLNIENCINLSYKGTKITNSTDFANLLLDEALIASVPGIAFGMENHIRISYATSMEIIREGMDRLEQVLSKLK